MNIRYRTVSLLTTILALICHADSASAQPAAETEVRAPQAAKRPEKTTLHGEELIDDYAWLRNRRSRDVLRHLIEENEYTFSKMESAEDLQEKLYDEFIARMPAEAETVPVKIDDYYYYDRYDDDFDFPIHCRKKGSMEGEEEIILDENDLAGVDEYFALGAMQVSPNHKLLAYSIDDEGSEKYELRVRDLEKKSDLADSLPNTAEFVVWGADNRTLYYCTIDETSRPYRVYRHRLGDDPRDDELLYEEKDPAFFVYVGETKSQAYVAIMLESNTTSEVRVIKTSDPKAEPVMIRPREQGIQYYLEHHGEKFYIVTNDGAPDFRLISAPVSAPGKENWEEAIAPEKGVTLEGVDVFENHLVLLERRSGAPGMTVVHLPSGKSHQVKLPEEDRFLEIETNPDFHTNIVRFRYSSLVTPETVYDYDMNAQTLKELSQDEVTDYDPADYVAERIYAKAKDGTQIPISVVYRKGLKRDGKSPLFLYGYGAYGLSDDPYFQSTLLTLLDRGMVYAMAHVRGGGELGRDWYEQGKMLNKPNSFSDFIACAEHLIEQKYTSAPKLAIYGASAGGMLVGTVVNMRPDLFQVAIADVPFVDVINTMRDTSIPLTATEHEEWGDPAEKKYYEVMRSYSPYENVGRQAYPHMLVTTSLNDSRVGFWEAAKWVARLRDLKTNDNDLLFITHLEGGHGGAFTDSGSLGERAFQYAFLLTRLGVEEAQ